MLEWYKNTDWGSFLLPIFIIEVCKIYKNLKMIYRFNLIDQYLLIKISPILYNILNIAYKYQIRIWVAVYRKFSIINSC